MDLKKTGEFIASLRKEKGLTQEQLAKEIFVTEKAVSKWECGNGFPDTSNLQRLSNCLGVSVNELLSGEKLTTPAECIEKADKNLLEAIKKSATIDTMKLMLFLFSCIATILIIPNLISLIIESVAEKNFDTFSGSIITLGILTVCGLAYIVYYLISTYRKTKK